jgi:hypothetical protein
MGKVILAIFLFLLPCFAFAQIPTSGNVFFGYSYLSSDLSPVGRAGLNGWEATLEGKFLPFIGLVADFSSNYGSQNFSQVVCPPVGLAPCVQSRFSANVTEHNYLFGPRVGVSVGKFRPFAEAMIGAAHVNASQGGSDTSLADAIGGGIDYRLLRILAWRLQGDYVGTRFFGGTQSNVRISTGIVVRF